VPDLIKKSKPAAVLPLELSIFICNAVPSEVGDAKPFTAPIQGLFGEVLVNNKPITLVFPLSNVVPWTWRRSPESVCVPPF